MALLAPGAPAAGQFSECEPGRSCRWTFAEPDDYDLGATWDRRLGSVAFGAALNTALAALNGQPLLASLWKSLVVSAGFELAMAADSRLTIEGGHVTPLGHIAGRLTNSLSANVVMGRPLCEDLRTGWLLVEVTYDCGAVDVAGNLTPLLGAAYFQLEGGQLDVRNTLALGVPVFRMPTDDSEVTGLAVGGAIGYEARPVLYGEDTFDGLEELLPSGSPEQLALLERAREWGRRAERNPRLMVTLLHERRHTNQFDYVEKLLAGPDRHWLLHRRIEVLPHVHLDLLPAATAAVWLLTTWQNPDDMPWEYPARANEKGVIEWDEFLWVTALGEVLVFETVRWR